MRLINFAILLIVLSLNTLNSSLFKAEYARREPLLPAQVITALERESGWSRRHRIFVEQIAF